MIDFCYVDESGGSDLLCEAAPTSSPVLVIAGLIVPGDQMRALIWDYLQLKKEYNPSLAGPTKKLSDLISTEVKGSNLRSDINSSSRRVRRRAIGFIDKTFGLAERYQCQLVARIFVKDRDVAIRDEIVYGASILWISRTFHQYLIERNADGLALLDSRTKVKNKPITDVVTTQKFRHGGDPLPRLLEPPVFGHSDSHVGLQIADIFASAVLFPAACHAYCQAHTWNHHAQSDYSPIVARYGQKLRALQFRYHDAAVGYWKGGIHAYGTASSLAANALFSSDKREFQLPAEPHLPGITLSPEAPEAAASVEAELAEMLPPATTPMQVKSPIV